ncbi:hypothetical protein BH10PLA1_BH10PLA1_20860 [soil metagenome]
MSLFGSSEVIYSTEPPVAPEPESAPPLHAPEPPAPTPPPVVIPPAVPDTSYVKWVLAGLLGLVAIYAVWASTVGWGNTLYSDRHQFRQSQTAINCFYMLQDGLALDYQTPVLGPPWKIPFELPLYQWIVAGVVKGLNAGLDPSGRAVSVLFYALTLVPMWFILGAIRVQRPHRLIFLTLSLVSPFYIFWSRAFMMESTAICLSASYAACVICYADLRAKGRPIKSVAYLVVLAVLFGSLAAMVKITTIFGFGVATAMFVGKDLFRWPIPKFDFNRWWRAGALLAVTGGISLIAGTLWTHHADAIKAASAMTKSMTSYSTQMIEWNFGKPGQRFALGTWDVILGRAGTVLSTNSVLWLGCLAALIVTRRRWKESLACVMLYLASPLVFVNLQWEHDYYMYANGLFLIAAVGFCVLGIFESPRGAGVGIAAMTVVIVASVLQFFSLYYPMQANNNTSLEPLIQAIKDKVSPDQAVIYMGLDWDSTIPYYTRRRAIMIPGWLTEDQIIAAMPDWKTFGVGGVVLVHPDGPGPKPAFLYEQMAKSGFDMNILPIINLNRSVPQ